MNFLQNIKMKIEYNNWPAQREWGNKDIREYVESDAWDYLYIKSDDDIDFNFIREFKDKINWDIQYFTLRNMHDRWSLKDQAFFKEFKKYIDITIDAWGEFGHYTGINHEN